jgi:hypothetical protein
MFNPLRKPPLAIAVLLLLMGSACSGNQLVDPGPGKRVAASIPQAAYVSGESVSVAITNVSSVPLVYPIGFCKTILQRREGATDWITVLEPSDGCPLAIGFLGPERSVSHQYVLPQLPTGTYRLAMPMPYPQGSTTPEGELTSPPFSVNAVAL